MWRKKKKGRNSDHPHYVIIYGRCIDTRGGPRAFGRRRDASDSLGKCIGRVCIYINNNVQYNATERTVARPFARARARACVRVCTCLCARARAPAPACVSICYWFFGVRRPGGRAVGLWRRRPGLRTIYYSVPRRRTSFVPRTYTMTNATESCAASTSEYPVRADAVRRIEGEIPAGRVLLHNIIIVSLTRFVLSPCAVSL